MKAEGPAKPQAGAAPCRSLIAPLGLGFYSYSRWALLSFMTETTKFLTHQLVGENIWLQLKIDARLEEYDVVASSEEEPAEFLALGDISTDLNLWCPIDACDRHHAYRQQSHKTIVRSLENNATPSLYRLPAWGVAIQVVLLGCRIPCDTAAHCIIGVDNVDLRNLAS